MLLLLVQLHVTQVSSEDEDAELLREAIDDEEDDDIVESSVWNDSSETDVDLRCLGRQRLRLSITANKATFKIKMNERTCFN